MNREGSSKAVLDRPRMLSADLGGPPPELMQEVGTPGAVQSVKGVVIGDRDSADA